MNAVEMVLLGAGASVKAGVPMAYGMTDAIIETLGTEFGDILAYVIGALQFQKGIEGKIPLGPEHRVDIESLASAVELLTTRNALEIAPFVTSWHSRLSQLEGSPGWHRRLMAGPEPTFSSRFDALRRLLPLDLLELTEIPEPGAGSYLLPLLCYQQAISSRLTIASVNYDRVIEMAAGANGIPVDTGLETWLAQGLLGPSGDGISLLKLHGSSDWWYDLRGKVVCPRPAEGDLGPALLFGRDKLTAKGPFLDLLMAFRQELQRASRLTVVGYSFRDAHVNEYIARWFEAASFRRLRVIDPDARWRDNTPCIGDTQIPVIPAAQNVRSRIEILQLPAEEAIRDAFPQ